MPFLSNLPAVEGHFTAGVSMAQWICIWRISTSSESTDRSAILYMCPWGSCPTYFWQDGSMHRLERRWDPQSISWILKICLHCHSFASLWSSAVLTDWSLRPQICTWCFTSHLSSVWECSWRRASPSPGSSHWCCFAHLWACSPHRGDTLSVPLSFYASCEQKLHALQTPVGLQPETTGTLVAPNTDMATVGLSLETKVKLTRVYGGWTQNDLQCWQGLLDGLYNWAGLLVIKMKDQSWWQQETRSRELAASPNFSKREYLILIYWLTSSKWHWPREIII